MTQQLNSQKILIIEDDPNTANLVRLYLEREGFRVFTAGDGNSGLALARQHSPGLVILDLMLPYLDGWEVCRRLRQRSDVPVIMLTARGEEIDRVAGLTLGADDYVVKPFSPAELVARVKAVLRRAPRMRGEMTMPLLSHGDVQLDLEKRSLTVSGRRAPLTPHEYTLLETLMSSPGRAYTRDELLERLYPRGEAMVVDRVVDVHVGKLRQKIEKDPSNPRLILTVRGIGYCFTDDTASAPGNDP